MMREEPKTAVSFRRNREDNDCMCPVIYDQNKALLLTELVEQYEPTMLRIAQRYGVSTESAGDVARNMVGYATRLAEIRGSFFAQNLAVCDSDQTFCYAEQTSAAVHFVGCIDGGQ